MAARKFLLLFIGGLFAIFCRAADLKDELKLLSNSLLTLGQQISAAPTKPTSHSGHVSGQVALFTAMHNAASKQPTHTVGELHTAITDRMKTLRLSQQPEAEDEDNKFFDGSEEEVKVAHTSPVPIIAAKPAEKPIKGKPLIFVPNPQKVGSQTFQQQIEAHLKKLSSEVPSKVLTKTEIEEQQLKQEIEKLSPTDKEHLIALAVKFYPSEADVEKRNQKMANQIKDIFFAMQPGGKKRDKLQLSDMIDLKNNEQLNRILGIRLKAQPKPEIPEKGDEEDWGD